ncbi:MAG: alpha/beta hydrolase, partial [Robiginitomaculum sp.]|nr:alpha/beta hydrolase [Robiginitomaculum sp.]
MKLITKLCFASTLFLASCSGVSILNTITPSGSYTLAKNISYSDGARQALDIYTPDTPKANAPVVVYIYGGSWDSGDKKAYKFIGEAFASEGYTTVIPNYRLYPEAVYPAFVKDTAAAIAFTAKRFDRPVVVISHSAGAYNAMMVMVDPAYLNAQGRDVCGTIAGTVGMAGPYGAFPLKEEPYITIFPNKHMGDDAPVQRKLGPTPPMFLPIGDKDTTVSDLHSRELAKKVEARGGKVEFKLYPDLNHTDMAKVLSKYFDDDATLKADILAFIKANSAR